MFLCVSVFVYCFINVLRIIINNIFALLTFTHTNNNLCKLYMCNSFIPKQTLADIYAKDYARNVATLMRWIKKDKALMNRLIELGYEATQKHFTPAQVAILEEKFGKVNTLTKK